MKKIFLFLLLSSPLFAGVQVQQGDAFTSSTITLTGVGIRFPNGSVQNTAAVAGASALGVNYNGVSQSSPTAQINFVGNGVSVSATGSTATVTINSTGNISSIVAGNGLSGGGSSGTVTLNAAGVSLSTQTTGILPIANGGSGQNSPSLISGQNIGVMGSWPNQTIGFSGQLAAASVANGTLGSGVIASSVAVGAVPLTGPQVSGILPVTSGGSGTASPGLIAGSNILSITGSWPNQTINAATQSGGGGGTSALGIFNGAVLVSSPTGGITFDSNTIAAVLQGGATAAVTLKASSVTLQGNFYNLAALAASTGTLTTLVNNKINFSSITATQPAFWNNTTGVMTVAAVSLSTSVAGILPVANGGSGSASPSLVAGTNITSITGTWPNQTINAAASGGGGGSSALEILAGVRVTSPTATISFGPGFIGNATTASTATITFSPSNSAINTLTSSLTVTGSGGLTMIYGVTATTITATSTATVAALALTGLGELTFQNNSDTTTYKVVGTSQPVTIGHIALFSQDDALTDGGTPLVFAAGPRYSVQFASGVFFAGTSGFQYNGSSLTLTSSMTINTGGGADNFAPGVLDIFTGADSFHGRTLFAVGSSLANDQFYIQDGLPVNMTQEGATIGNLGIGSTNVLPGIGADSIFNVVHGSFQNLIDFSSGTNLQIQTAATVNNGGAVVLAGNLTEELRASGVNGVTVTSTSTFNGNITTNANLYISSGIIMNGSLGTSGQFLASSGTTAAPTWTTLAPSAASIQAGTLGASVIASSLSATSGSITPGTNVTTSGSWPNITVNAAISGGGAALGSTQTWSGGNTYLSSSTYKGAVLLSTTVYLNGSVGTNGQVMTSGGPGAIPTWTTTVSGGSISTAAVVGALLLGREGIDANTQVLISSAVPACQEVDPAFSVAVSTVNVYQATTTSSMVAVGFYDSSCTKIAQSTNTLPGGGVAVTIQFNPKVQLAAATKYFVCTVTNANTGFYTTQADHGGFVGYLANLGEDPTNYHYFTAGNSSTFTTNIVMPTTCGTRGTYTAGLGSAISYAIK